MSVLTTTQKEAKDLVESLKKQLETKSLGGGRREAELPIW